ncbi:hypothetical protein [Vagococcus sp.]|uniref:hypothetical protein n=1 Tax=Vagococcus sp. TaxID=1933889 RepID=UPI002FC92D60
MYTVKTNPKNKRHWFFLLLLYIVSFFYLTYSSYDKSSFWAISFIFIGLSLFLYLEGKATLTITKDNYIYANFGKKIYSKKDHKLRADGQFLAGFGNNYVKVYRLRIIHGDTYETVKEIRMSMSSKDYDKCYAELKEIGEFK